MAEWESKSTSLSLSQCSCLHHHLATLLMLQRSRQLQSEVPQVRLLELLLGLQMVLYHQPGLQMQRALRRAMARVVIPPLLQNP